MSEHTPDRGPLKLANILQHQIPSQECLELAAAELRRLDSINKELLAALKEVLAAERATATPPRTAMQAEANLNRIRAAVAQAEAAITKATGEQT